jgi:hypothetical protein
MRWKIRTLSPFDAAVGRKVPGNPGFLKGTFPGLPASNAYQQMKEAKASDGIRRQTMFDFPVYDFNGSEAAGSDGDYEPGVDTIPNWEGSFTVNTDLSPSDGSGTSFRLLAGPGSPDDLS